MAQNVNDFLKICCLLKFYKIWYFAFRANKTILLDNPFIWGQNITIGSMTILKIYAYVEQYVRYQEKYFKAKEK